MCCVRAVCKCVVFGAEGEGAGGTWSSPPWRLSSFQELPLVWCGVPKALLPKGKRPGCLPTGTGKRAGLCVLCARRA